MGAPKTNPKITWLGSAGYAGAGCLATVAVAGMLALLCRLALEAAAPTATMTPVAHDVRAFHSVLDTVVIVILLMQVLVAALLPLPLQATALLLRRRGADGAVYAKVAGLALLSSLVSFAVLYPALSSAKLLMRADDQALLFALALTFIYILHMVSLVVGRRFAQA